MLQFVGGLHPWFLTKICQFDSKPEAFLAWEQKYLRRSVQCKVYLDTKYLKKTKRRGNHGNTWDEKKSPMPHVDSFHFWFDLSFIALREKLSCCSTNVTKWSLNTWEIGKREKKLAWLKNEMERAIGPNVGKYKAHAKRNVYVCICVKWRRLELFVRWVRLLWVCFLCQTLPIPFYTPVSLPQWWRWLEHFIKIIIRASHLLNACVPLALVICACVLTCVAFVVISHDSTLHLGLERLGERTQWWNDAIWSLWGTQS